MGFIYQELKRIKKSSIVLEQQENIEIRQNSRELSKTRSTFLREKFYSRPQKSRDNRQEEKKKEEELSSKSAAGIYQKRVLEHSLILEKDHQEKFEKRVHDTSCQLANLEEGIKNDIKKLQEQVIMLLKNKKMERRKYTEGKYQSRGQEETWAEQLAGNNSKERKQHELEVAKEKFSLQHQCICTSPRYTDDKDLAPRPRLRSVASQISTKKEFLDHGAVGDHNCFSNLESKNGKKVEDSKAMSNGCLQKEPANIKNNDIIVNWCCEHPFCHFSFNTKAGNNNACHHSENQRVGANRNCEYIFCGEEYYYDCENSGCAPQCSRFCKPSTSLRRQRTDLNTEHFYCRCIERSFSPDSRSDKKSRRKTKETLSKNKESYEERTARKIREYEKFKEQSNKRHSRQLRDQQNGKRSSLKDDLYKILNEGKTSKLLEYIDRYIDERENALKLKDHEAAHIQHGSPASISHQVTNERYYDTNTEYLGSSNNESLESPYSSKTLDMLKKMKILEYKPRKPIEQGDQKKRKSSAENKYNQQEKEKNYQQYLEKYVKESEAKGSIEVLKEPTETLRRQESVEADIYKQAPQKSTAKESVIKEQQDFTASRNAASLSLSNQDSSQGFEGGAKTDITNYSYIEGTSKPYFKDPHSHDKSTENVERNEQILQEILPENYQGTMSDAVWTRDHNGSEKSGGSIDYTDISRKSKDEEIAQSISKYDAQETEHALQQKQSQVDDLEESLTETQPQYKQLPQPSVQETENETVQSLQSYSRQEPAEPAKRRENEQPRLIRSHSTEETETQSAIKQNDPIITNLTESEINLLNQKKGISRLEEIAQELDLNGFDEMKQKFPHSSTSYLGFKKVMDHNLGIFAHTSSQTDNNFEIDLIEKLSKQTFTEEIEFEQTSRRPATTEEALKYLENFLKAYKQTGIEEQCLASVTTAANDLIKKLSSCKSLLADQVLTSQEYFEDPKKSSEDKLINDIEENTTKQGIQYKDPESTPNSSDFQLNHPMNAKENLSFVVENDPQVEQKEGLRISTESNAQELDQPYVMKDIASENCDLYQLQSQTDTQQQRYHHHKKSTNSLTPAEDFSDTQPIHYDITYKKEYSKLCMNRQFPYTGSSSCSRYPIFDPSLMPSKSILKPCRVMENLGQDSSDFHCWETATSVVSFEQEAHIDKQRGSSMTYNQVQERIDEHANENVETIITKDLHSNSKQSNLTETTAIQEATYQDYQLETESMLESTPRDNSPTPFAVEMPAFRQCPCMWETYMEMMANIYKGKEKTLIES